MRGGEGDGEVPCDFSALPFFPFKLGEFYQRMNIKLCYLPPRPPWQGLVE